MRFNDWLRGNNKNRNNDSNNMEYYEDTHDFSGNYIGPVPVAKPQPQPHSKRNDLDIKNTPNDFTEQFGEAGKNIIVYKPTSTKEVETLIRCLQRGESAVANLNDLVEEDAQRILDFLSGATFALGGNIYRITGNIFLLSPSGVSIQSY